MTDRDIAEQMREVRIRRVAVFDHDQLSRRKPTFVGDCTWPNAASPKERC